MPIESKPGATFSHLVEKVWLRPRKGGPGEGPLEILPDAQFALGFGISDQDCRILVGGPCTKAVRISVTDARDFLFIRFRPGRLPRVLDVRPAELVDETERGLSNLLGRSSDEWGERLGAVEGLQAKQRVLESLLPLARLEPLCQDRRCLRAVEHVEASQGRVQVSALAQELGVSTRTLERLFLEQIGLTPKRFIRNVRFQWAVHLLRTRPACCSMGRLAHACGYADQTHFIHDIKELSGSLPSAL
jgi:AraC-like DNA-binding protein